MTHFSKALIAFTFVFSAFNVAAQNDFYPCGTDEMSKASLQNNPALQLQRQQLEEFTQQFSETAGRSAVKKIIPVVFHIIHAYGSENISKQQVEDAVRIINEDFQKLNPDTGSVISTFQSVIGNVQVEFRLAKLDPGGNCTDGITRTVSDLTFDAGDNVKSLISWDTFKYLNIWVVDNISSGAGAYAYLPGSAPSDEESGIVCRNSQLGSIGASGGSNFASRTLTHEIGHHFNLFHIWGDGNTPGVATNCSQSDFVSDTPPTQGTSAQNCNLSQNTCTSDALIDNVQNYMDYSSCGMMFTAGQGTRMQAALNSTTGGLFYLWQNSNLIATGTNDGFTASPCAPIADFVMNVKAACTGTPVIFTDKSYNADVDVTWTWNWSFPGGTPSTSTLQNPTVTYSGPGLFNVTLTSTNGSGNNTKTKTQFVKIKSSSPVFTVPVFEGVENSSFPVNPSDAAKNWEIENSTSWTWGRTTSAAYTGSASLKIANASVTDGKINAFISPPIDLSNLTGTARLIFRSAYAKRNANSDDLLRVYVSTNCGQTWSLRGSFTSNNLVSNGGAFVTSNFVPTASQWAQKSVNINTVAGQASVRFKFECTSNDGNNLYIDDIQIGAIDIGIESEEANTILFSVFPNPIQEKTKIVYTLNKNEKVSLKLYDLLGREVGGLPVQEQVAGNYEVLLESLGVNFNPGVYFIELKAGNKKLVEKIVKTQ